MTWVLIVLVGAGDGFFPAHKHVRLSEKTNYSEMKSQTHHSVTLDPVPGLLPMLSSFHHHHWQPWWGFKIFVVELRLIKNVKLAGGKGLHWWRKLLPCSLGLKPYIHSLFCSLLRNWRPLKSALTRCSPQTFLVTSIFWTLSSLWHVCAILHTYLQNEMIVSWMSSYGSDWFWRSMQEHLSLCFTELVSKLLCLWFINTGIHCWEQYWAANLCWVCSCCLLCGFTGACLPHPGSAFQLPHQYSCIIGLYLVMQPCAWYFTRKLDPLAPEKGNAGNE